MSETEPHARRKKHQEPREKKPLMGGVFTKYKPTQLLGKLTSKKENAEKRTGKAKPDTVAGNGTVIQSKGALLGKAAAWIAVAFVLIASMISIGQFLNPPAQAGQAIEAKEDPASQQAGDYARGFVAAWLRATRDNDAEVTRYMAPEQGDITARESAKVRALNTASVQNNDDGVSTVVVSAEVMKAPAGDAKEGAWTPVWYQVNIHHQAGRFTPLGWPAPIPTPMTGKAPQLAYTYDGSKEISSTIDAFFKAYVLGEGDVSRMTNPKSSIRALGQTPYNTVEISDVTTEKDSQKGVPADGQTEHALVRIALGTDKDTARSATYALTLETRGGRWEVLAIDPAPVLSATQPVEGGPANQDGGPSPSITTGTDDAPASE